MNFTKLDGPLDQMEFHEQTLESEVTMQIFLLEYVRRISQGKVGPRVAAWKIGSCTVVNIIAKRLMCLWTRGAYPVELEKRLYHAIKFIVEVYAVSWFEMKVENA